MVAGQSNKLTKMFERLLDHVSLCLGLCITTLYAGFTEIHFDICFTSDFTSLIDT